MTGKLIGTLFVLGILCAIAPALLLLVGLVIGREFGPELIFTPILLGFVFATLSLLVLAVDILRD